MNAHTIGIASSQDPANYASREALATIEAIATVAEAIEHGVALAKGGHIGIFEHELLRARDRAVLISYLAKRVKREVNDAAKVAEEISGHAQLISADGFVVKQALVDDFADALSAVERVTVELEAFDTDQLCPASRAFETADKSTEETTAVAYAAFQPTQARYDALVRKQGEAFLVLMARKAPDLTALHRKLALYAKHELHSWTGAEHVASYLANDAARLAQGHA